MKYTWTFFKKIESLCTDLSFLESTASSQNIGSYVIDRCLQSGTSSFGDSVDIFLWNSTCTENSSICEPLSSKISNRQLWENNVGSNIMDLLQFIINDLPFCIYDTLEIVDVTNSNLGILFLRFELKLYFEDNDLRINEFLRLLLKTSIWKCFFEGHSTY